MYVSIAEVVRAAAYMPGVVVRLLDQLLQEYYYTLGGIATNLAIYFCRCFS